MDKHTADHDLEESTEKGPLETPRGDAEPSEDDSSLSDGDMVTLRIKPTTPISCDNQQLSIRLSRQETAGTLKERVRNLFGSEGEGRYIRLITCGKLLAPDGATLESFGVGDGTYVHAVLAASGVKGGRQMGKKLVSSCDDDSSSSFSSEDEDDAAPADLELGTVPRSGRRHRRRRPPRGFDRLRAGGMTAGTVRAVRNYFSRHVNTFIDALPDRPGLRSPSPDEDVGEYRRRMEDLWMATQGPTSEFQLNVNANNARALLTLRGRPQTPMPDAEGNLVPPSVASPLAGTDRDFVWGFLLGFFVGFVMLFWMWLPSMPHRQKLGIIAGITFQVGVNLLLEGGGEMDGV